MENVARRIEVVKERYPALRGEIENLGRAISENPEAAQFTNREEYTNFWLAEVMGLYNQDVLQGRDHKILYLSFQAPSHISSVAVPLTIALDEEVKRGGGGERADPYLLTWLGRNHDRGYGVKKDPNKALEFYKPAIDRGFVNAMRQAAGVYFAGRKEEDFRKGFPLYHRAADLGCVTSKFCVARYYDMGYGVNKNKAEATKYYQMVSDVDCYEGTESLAYNAFKKLNLKMQDRLMPLAARQGSSHYNRLMGIILRQF